MQKNNDIIRDSIFALKLQHNLQDPAKEDKLLKLLNKEQLRVFRKNKESVIGTKRRRINTATVVPPPLSGKEMANLKTAYHKAKEKNAVEQFMQSLRTQAQKNYVEKYRSQPVSGIEGYCPLVNVGNSCYMNAAMQLLFSIPEFRNQLGTVIKSWETETIADCNDVSELTLRTFFRAINIFFAGMQRNALTGGFKLEVTKFRGSTGKVVYDEIIDTLELGKYEQEDVGEYIEKIFSKLFCFTSLAPLKKLFSISTTYQITCQNPAFLPAPRKFSELFMNFTIDDPLIHDMQSCIDVAQMETAGEDDNLEVCGGGKAQSLKTTFTIPATTKYLLCRLGRLRTIFNKKTGTFQLIKDRKAIALNPILVVDGVQFRLRMCVCHLGQKAQSGHYVAYRFDESGKLDGRFDDADIYYVDGDEEMIDAAVELRNGLEYGKKHNEKVLIGALVVLYERIEPVVHVGGQRKTRKRRSDKKRRTYKH